MQLRIALGCLLILAPLGCSSARSQVSQVQSEKEQLIAAIKEQKEQLDALRDKNERLAAQLNEAEIEIARGPSFDGRRFAAKSLEKDQPIEKIADKTNETTRSRTDNNKPAAVATSPAAPKAAVAATPSEVNSKLPWKPDRKSSSVTTASGSTLELKKWAEQRNWLKFDDASESVAVTLPLEFSADGHSLTSVSKAKLKELADLLQSEAGKNLRVMVAGQTTQAPSGEAEGRYTNSLQPGSARALAVADYLDKSGISSNRLGISAVPAPDASAANAPRLSIYVLPEDAPVVGWTPPADTIRR